MPFAPHRPGGRVHVDADRRSRSRSRRAGAAVTGEHLQRPAAFTLAQGLQSLDAAFRLVHDQYVWRHYMEPSRSGRRLSVHHALRTTKVFVARVGFQVVGTMTLIQDSEFGLPMDDLYRAELAPLRAAGRRVAEASALAVHADYRAAGAAIFLRLMRIVLIYAVEIARIDDLCLTVNPRHVAFYRQFFDVEPFGGLASFAKVNGAPAVALRLDMHRVRAIIDGVHGADRGRDAVHDFLYGSEHYQRVMDRLLRDLCEPELTRECFSHVFCDESVLAEAEPSVEWKPPPG
jgi:N-acyl amino acid synthase FeeM